MSCKSSNQVYDTFRKRWVRATPEELVRQRLLKYMVEQGGYPSGLLAVEQKIPSLRRRVDLLCYGAYRLGEALSPLLVVECKAALCKELAKEQALGYHAVVGAPFVCLAGQTDILTLWMERGKLVTCPFLPHYQDLLQRAPLFFSDGKSSMTPL